MPLVEPVEASGEWVVVAILFEASEATVEERLEFPPNVGRGLLVVDHAAWAFS